MIQLLISQTIKEVIRRLVFCLRIQLNLLKIYCPNALTLMKNFWAYLTVKEFMSLAVDKFILCMKEALVSL